MAARMLLKPILDKLFIVNLSIEIARP